MRAVAIVAEQVLERRLGVVAHRRVGLGPEVLDDHLLEVPVAAVHVPQGEQRVDALTEGLPDPDQQPRGEGHRQPAGVLEGLQPAAGSLSGAWKCAWPLASSRSEVVSSMMPIDAETCLSVAMSDQLITPGLRWGSSPVASMTWIDTARRYSQRRLVPAGLEPRPRRRVAVLGLVPEREQHLGAACGLAGPGDVRTCSGERKAGRSCFGGHANVQ
jgi:hypothetical protein